MRVGPVLLLLLSPAVLPLVGDTPDADAPPAANANLPEQNVGPNDLLSLAVADCPELTRSFRVAADGTLSLPLLQERIQAAGKDPREIENEISEALKKEQILVSPVVAVSVAEYRSLPVSVLGAVRHPITFQAAGEVRLMDALTRADGLSPDAGPEILVGRPAKDGQPGLTRRVSVKELVEEANPALNMRLYGGEEIRVPEAGRVFVLGNVKHPGAFTIQDSGDLSVLKVIAESEGLAPYASKEAFIYRKEAGAGGRSEIPIPLKEIMDRKAPDMALQSNDIVYIPDDKHRRMSAEAVERIAGFGMATVSGLLVFH